jgi:hypothetical protein
MKQFDLRKFLSENKFTIGNTNKKSNTTSVKVDTLVESKKIKEVKKEKADSINEASLGDKIMRALFYNPDAQVPRKLNTYSWFDAFPASDPREYKKAVKNMKDVELTNYWDTVRRKKYTFNKNQEFMKKLIKIEMETRGLKMLPDLGK